MLNQMEKKKKRINHISFWRFFRENVFLYCFKNYKSHAQNDFYFYFEVLVTPKYFGRIIYQLHCNVFWASSCFTMSNIKLRCIQTCIFRVIMFLWNINDYFEWVSHSVSFLKRFFLHRKAPKYLYIQDKPVFTLILDNV